MYRKKKKKKKKKLLQHLSIELFLLFSFLVISIPGSLGSIRPPNATNPSAPAATDFPEDPSRPSSGIRKAKVLYDYEASDTSELSLLADEVMQFINHPFFNQYGRLLCFL